MDIVDVAVEYSEYESESEGDLFRVGTGILYVLLIQMRLMILSMNREKVDNVGLVGIELNRNES